MVFSEIARRMHRFLNQYPNNTGLLQALFGIIKVRSKQVLGIKIHLTDR